MNVASLAASLRGCSEKWRMRCDLAASHGRHALKRHRSPAYRGDE
jgi:hypothetical protein